MVEDNFDPKLMLCLELFVFTLVYKVEVIANFSSSLCRLCKVRLHHLWFFISSSCFSFWCAMLNKNKKKQLKRKKRRGPSDISTRIPKNLMSAAPFPVSMTRKLLFHTLGQVNGAVPFRVAEHRINGAFSPDTVGTPGGFNELAKIYNSYKVNNVRVRYNIVSNEAAIPIFFALIFRSIQPSTKILAYADVLNAVELAPTSGPQLVGEISGSSVYHSPWYHIHPGAVLGNPAEYKGSTLYGSVVTSNPAALIWSAFLAYSPAPGTNLTNGVFLDYYLEMTVRFYTANVLEE